MTQIRFYHLESTTLDQALPSLAMKAFEAGKRILIKTADVREAARLNDHLWTFHPNVFLPHGTENDKHPDRQPILITAGNDNLNNADMLILTAGAGHETPEDFALVCEMLDGRSAAQVDQGRQRWKTYKEAGHDLTYWQQNPSGGWAQKE